MTLAIILGAIILSATTYLVFERLGRRALLPVAARSVAWAGLGLLLFNVSCPTPGSDRVPLILIDGSLSMRSDTAAFRRIRDSAAVAGDVVFFGDERAAVDSLPRGRSRIRDRLQAAVVSGRPVQVITDGELEDGAELTEELLAGVAVDLRPRVDTAAVVLTQVRGPARLTAGDTLVIETQGFAAKSHYHWAWPWRAARPSLLVRERLTRVDETTIDYRFTIEDEVMFERPWTASSPMTTDQASRGVTEGPIFEYACHEGNYALPNVLSGARATESE